MAALYAPLDSYSWYTGTEDERLVFWLCAAMLGQMVVASVLLVGVVEAWYGRYNHQNSGIDTRLAWIIQESPTLIFAAVCWVYGRPECKSNPVNCLVLFCWVVHYVNRTIIYPLRTRGAKKIPPSIVLMAICFCSVNGYIQCRSITRYLLVPLSWTTPVGFGLWSLGLWINMDSDRILRELRAPGETGYKIPQGGMFRYVSGANFFGEIIEWSGFAILMGGALPGVTFAVCTVCNIGPRAITHHRWYLQKFKDEYPKDRKALIPFLL